MGKALTQGVKKISTNVLARGLGPVCSPDRALPNTPCTGLLRGDGNGVVVEPIGGPKLACLPDCELHAAPGTGPLRSCAVVSAARDLVPAVSHLQTPLAKRLTLALRS